MIIEDGVLICYTERNKIVVVPEGVEEIGDWAFSYANICSYARSVLPERLLALPRRTRCLVEKVILPPSLKKIGKEVFKFEDNLKEVVFAEGLESIGESAFFSCSSLIEVTLPKSIKSVSENAFNKCLALTKVVIPHVLNGSIAGKRTDNCISESLFYYCSALKEVYIPEGTKIIGPKAFQICISLTEMIIPNSVEEIGEFAFSSCSSLIEINLPESIKSVSRNVFYRCHSLTKVVISHAVNGCIAGKSSKNCISDGLFSQCYALKEVSIPEGTKIIGGRAFEQCKSLTEINIPDSVEEIGEQAFDYCINIREIKLPRGIKKIGREAFPCGVKSKLENILVAPENETYCSVDGVLYTKDFKSLIHCPTKYTKTIFVVPDGVEEICPCAFEGCENIRKVVIPDSVIRIGEKAFRYMSNLKTVVLPTFLNELQEETFAYCLKLNNVIWPTASFNIGEGCFRQSGFKTISLPDNVKSVGDYAFAYHLADIAPSRIVADKVILPKLHTAVSGGSRCGGQRQRCGDSGSGLR